ncbi:MAG: hypothetical protein LYZ69_07240 [Nitrososphaerales archaeon]|nr:hypothetical protein [Nitrososphaerales archaeon]
MCAIVFYMKLIKGKLYPRAARTGPYAFAQEVSRVHGKVVTRYIGIAKLPKNAAVTESGSELDETNAIEKGEEHNNHSREPEQV